MATMESDEALARRLQAQELGAVSLPQRPGTQTPLMRTLPGASGNNENANPTVINARINEISMAWTTVGMILTVNIPQIIAGMVILGKYWGVDHTCDDLHMRRWSWWAAVSMLRMIAYSAIVLFIQLHRETLQTQTERYLKLASMRNTMEAFALIWFVVGNMWLFGDDDNSCTHPQSSHIYNLCLSYIILMYMQICAPCIIAIMILPVFCFCLPCFIRILARMHDPTRNQGAPQALIDTLPVVTITQNHIAQSSTCPICLNDMQIGEAARHLRCSHLFHQHCVDEWLRVNATCPTCRKSIREEEGDDPGREGGTAGLGGGGTSNVLLQRPAPLQSMAISTSTSARDDGVFAYDRL